MAHKVHPKSFRIKGTEDWNIRGFYGRKMPQYLEEDFLVKDFLRKKLIEASVANIQIEHSANKMNVIIETARPGLIIGRGGGGGFGGGRFGDAGRNSRSEGSLAEGGEHDRHGRRSRTDHDGQGDW